MKAGSPSISDHITASLKLSTDIFSIEKSDEVLSYGIGNAYAGIIDQDGVFGYLKQFLKEFGNLCFGLQTKSNFTKLSYDQTDTVDFYSNFTKDGEYKESYA